MLRIAAKLASDPNNQLPPEGAAAPAIRQSRSRGPCLHNFPQLVAGRRGGRSGKPKQFQARQKALIYSKIKLQPNEYVCKQLLN